MHFTLRAAARRRRAFAPLVALAAIIVPVLAACGASGPSASVACVEADATNTIQLTAKDQRFNAPCLVAQADRPVVIEFRNLEAGVPHDVAVYTDASKAQELVRSEIITGPDAATTATVPARGAGDLFFECTIHTSMHGTLTLRAASPSP